MSGDNDATSASIGEQVDFLKSTVAFAEAGIRSFDTKAQISLAAFVLSANPIVSIISPRAGSSVLSMFLAAYIVSILLYGYVLWPVSPPKDKLRAPGMAQDLFYLHKPWEPLLATYSAKLGKLVSKDELIAELFKLSYIRSIKNVRFRIALAASLATYIMTLIMHIRAR